MKSEREAKIPSRLQLNDELALFRTHLANERTLMAYLRSGVALVIAGASILHFVEGGWLLAVGLICIPSGVAAAALGVLRFRVMSQSINRRARVHRATRPREAQE